MEEFIGQPGLCVREHCGTGADGHGQQAVLPYVAHREREAQLRGGLSAVARGHAVATGSEVVGLQEPCLAGCVL